MKQKVDNLPVTHAELKQELAKSEIRLEERLDKKFSERLLKSQIAFRNELRHEFEVREARWDKRFSDFANMILNAIDPLIQDMKIRQEERAIAAAQYREVKDDVEDLKKRVNKLEHA